ncbi:hypothetical protein D3C81_2075330 [compost metagenome]
MRLLRSWLKRGCRPWLSRVARYLGLVPKTVMRSCSIRSSKRCGPGWKGEPSYNTMLLPTASAETSQFHIIQPQVV